MKKIDFVRGYKFRKSLGPLLCVFLCVCTGSFLNSCATVPKGTYLNDRSLLDISKVAIVVSLSDPKVSYHTAERNVSASTVPYYGAIPALLFLGLVATGTEAAIRSGVDRGTSGEIKEHTDFSHFEEKVAQSFIQRLKKASCFQVAEYLADKNQQGAKQLSAKGYNAVVRLLVREISLKKCAGDNVCLYAYVRGEMENLSTGKIVWDREEQVSSPWNHPLDYYRKNGLKELNAMLEIAGRNLAMDFFILTIIRASGNKVEAIDVSNQALLSDVRIRSTDPDLIAFLESHSLGGYQPLMFKLGGETFSSKEEALARMDKKVDEALSGISPSKTPLHGTATVVIPTIERIQRTGTKSWGNLSENNKMESIDYVSKYTNKSLESTYKAIEKRQIFDKVNLVHSPTPDDASAGTGDYVIYYDNPSPGLDQWYVKGKDWASPRPVNANKAIPGGTQRTASWLDDLEESIRRGAPK
jgi:hypothetical protein